MGIFCTLQIHNQAAQKTSFEITLLLPLVKKSLTTLISGVWLYRTNNFSNIQWVRIPYLLHLNFYLNIKTMESVKTRILETIIKSFHSPVVAGLNYLIKLNKLIIYYHSDGDKEIDFEIIFENPRGFKLLDEGDMYNYWEDKMMVKDWLFEITSGGWLDREDAAGGFISKALGFREFLITGIDDCVSVISHSEPLIEKRQEVLE